MSDDGIYRYEWELGEYEPAPVQESEPIEVQVEQARVKNEARRQKQAQKSANDESELVATISQQIDDSARHAAHADAVSANALRDADPDGDSYLDLAADLAELADAVPTDGDPDALDDDGEERPKKDESDDKDDEESEDEGSDDEERPKELKNLSQKKAIAELKAAGVDVDSITIQNREGAEITLRDALTGGLREAEFTRRSQVLASERDTFYQERDAARAEVAQLSAHYDSALQQTAEFVEAFAASLPPEIQQSVGPAMQELAQRRQAVQEHQRQQMAMQEANHIAAQRAEHAENLNYQRQQLRELAGWKSDADYKQGMSEVAAYVRERGGNDADLAQIGQSAHYVDIVRRAMLYDRGQQRMKDMPKPKVQQSDKPTLKPGAVTRDTGRKARRRSHQASMDRLGRTGDPRDAADVFIGLGLVD